LIHGDCFDKLIDIPDKSVDFVYLDLNYNQTACKWDKDVIDLEALWVHLKRIARNDRTPFFFSCTTRFGFNLIKANEKWFRWDLVWKKNRASGFLNAYKLPMRKHEMIYCFAEKSPEYDVSSHKDGGVVKDNTSFQILKNHCYGGGEFEGKLGVGKDGKGGIRHKIPLPTSDITPPELNQTGKAEMYGITKTGKRNQGKKDQEPLPNSDITPPTTEHELVYCFAKKSPEYDVSSHKTGEEVVKPASKDNIYLMEHSTGGKECMTKPHKGQVLNEPLPTSDITPSTWCEFNNDEKTGHRTAKPVALMEFLLKYWTKPGWTVLDPTMGSGSMGIACKKMGRNFIGIERDDDIYELACNRISKTIL
jgi:DNA modification methylase